MADLIKRDTWLPSCSALAMICDHKEDRAEQPKSNKCLAFIHAENRLFYKFLDLMKTFSRVQSHYEETRFIFMKKYVFSKKKIQSSSEALSNQSVFANWLKVAQSSYSFAARKPGNENKVKGGSTFIRLILFRRKKNR